MTRSVLIVEPDGATREMLGAALSYEGYQVTLNGEYDRAFAQIVERRPGLIILSHYHWLPGAAQQLIARIRREPRCGAIPIIVTFSDPHVLKEHADVLRLPRVDALLRPFDLDDLFRRMDGALARNAPAGSIVGAA